MSASSYRRYVKRPLDVIFAAIALIVLAPLMAILAVLIALTSGRPVLFRQERIGHGERIIHVIKFRTMIDARDSSGKLLPDGRRLTRLGRILRVTSLDELPQLWNILCGDMSFIGPRPLRVEYLPYYTVREEQRHAVRPGLTGLAQISGRNALGWDDRLECDVQYVERQSLSLDLYIGLVTILRVLRPENVILPDDEFRSLYDCRPPAAKPPQERRAA